jgi:hypothetical protein
LILLVACLHEIVLDSKACCCTQLVAHTLECTKLHLFSHTLLLKARANGKNYPPTGAFIARKFIRETLSSASTKYIDRKHLSFHTEIQMMMSCG